MTGSLLQLLVFLVAAAVAAPLGRMCGFGSILGYLLAGIIIAQTGLSASLGDPNDLRHTAELGVAMFLFLIGLELRPRRLWAMRNTVFGAGGAQVGVTSIVFMIVAYTGGLDLGPSLLIGLALSLSATPLALQTLEEKGELTTRHGRMAFSILLFQDIAAIPMIAIVPFLALTENGSGVSVSSLLQGIVVFAAIILAGRYVLNPIYRLIASTGAREAMTAGALLTIIGVVYLMDYIGLSATLGAFLAGVLLADSEYRHQIEADIAPFQGLLLGLFFITIGMSLNIDLLLTGPNVIFSAVATITLIKALIVYFVGLWQGLNLRSARRLAIVLSPGGEFGFVLLAAAAGSVIDHKLADGIAVAITISMAMTPLLLIIDDFVSKRFERAEPQFDTPPKAQGHVVVAGFGRFGQIVARVLRATQIPFTALDINAEQVNFVNQFGNKIYYGDASRLGILEAARTQDARAFVLAIDDVETSIRTAQVVRTHFPHVPIYARARNRQHVHRLTDLGIEEIERETFLSSLELTKTLLKGLGTGEGRAKWIIETFKESDERRLYDDYKHYTDTEKVQLYARKQSQELAELFAEDAAERAAKTEPLVVKKAGPTAKLALAAKEPPLQEDRKQRPA
ncbi:MULTISPECIES: monovalent cation:proton antiporter-2 (CPA2) family protein [Rhodomicrobium]|uniref:monovalent cation:proton antiporter-2 (CPA2) family protein n=1 Tax=Rhodomicrobium TaxID=1068 RepID=UPI000B4A9F3D|nr:MULTISPECIES: monovalent cation:proton antiporter-2 (CPA2) family protein [Rhodomicrobium]